MERIKKYLPWTIRVIIFLLFMVSGIAKMFPIWLFEKQLVDLGITSWCLAPYLSRLLIALEIALGIAILQRHFIKKIIIPATILLLIAFCIHLAIEMFKHGAMNGNCGCFGQLIPMTPLEAFIKNIIIIGLLIYLYLNVKGKEMGQNKFIYLLLIYLASALFMFLVFPFCPCSAGVKQTENIIKKDSIQIKTSDTIIQKDIVVQKNNIVQKDTAGKIVIKDEVKQIKIIEEGPKKVNSKFSGYTIFGNKKVNLDEGKKIICLFAAGCDHCREAAKAICALSKNDNVPEVYILFLDEETDLIPDFFKEAQCNFNYRVIAASEFFQLLGSNANTPGVFYLWNGNIMKFYEGESENKFDAVGLKKAYESKYK